MTRRESAEWRGRTVLVTGASSGIGRAFAGEFAAHGFDVVLCARRAARLDELAAALAAAHGVRAHTLALDLAEPGSPARVQRELADRGLTIDALVNAAGRSLPGAYAATAWDEQRRLLDLTLGGYAELTHRLLPGMVSRGWGRIVQVASVSAFLPGAAGHTLSSAIKSFLVQFAIAVATESRGTGVNVTAVCPGFTRTEIFAVAGMQAAVARIPGWLWSAPEDVARAGYRGVMHGRTVVIPGIVNRLLVAGARLLPLGLAIALMRRGTGGLAAPRPVRER